MKRSLARESAFILIFEKSINDIDMAELIDAAVEARELVEDPFTRRVALGVYDNIAAIDATIEQNCVGWKLNRISKVSLAAMRLCCFEIMFEEDIPDSVSINEAVELTKKYAGEEDSSYVNGVLGSIVRK